MAQQDALSGDGGGRIPLLEQQAQRLEQELAERCRRLGRIGGRGGGTAH